MNNIELPRALEDYFAFAELEPLGGARRFSITMPYLSGSRLDRLQWWWRMSAGEEALLGHEGLVDRRRREIDRFKRHIERWLVSTSQRLAGNGPIPCIAPMPLLSAVGPAELSPEQSIQTRIDAPSKLAIG